MLLNNIYDTNTPEMLSNPSDYCSIHINFRDYGGQCNARSITEEEFAAENVLRMGANGTRFGYFYDPVSQFEIYTAAHRSASIRTPAFIDHLLMKPD
jgi:hypothetical protein